MSFIRSIRWKYTLIMVIVALFSVSVVGIYLYNWTENHYISTIKSELLENSKIAASLYLSESNKSGNIDSINNLSKVIRKRITIIDTSGKVILDSSTNPALMESHKNRLEVIEALKTGTGYSEHYSRTLKTRMIYVAYRINDDNGVYGVARVSENLSIVDKERNIIHKEFFLTALIAFIIAVLLGLEFSGKLIKPILDMNIAAKEFSKGILDYRIRTSNLPKDESSQLAESLNDMATSIQRMMDDLDDRNKELNAIFEKTNNGLIVVNKSTEILLLNISAERLFGVNHSQVNGQPIIKAIINRDITELIESVISTGKDASSETEICYPEHRIISVFATPLEKNNEVYGAIVVIHDLTKLKNADTVRRDFVANVSHELRTPLASIKAMAETIILRGKSDSEIANIYAGKIVTEIDRLTQLSEDLLDLAKIEAGRLEIKKEIISLNEIVSSISTEFKNISDKKNIPINIDIPTEIKIQTDKEALYRILVNLVDNALKYTQNEGRVNISAKQNENSTEIFITDTGIGISEEHLSRIFERFYRVDKARSRESGGTGLGLSIVKHLLDLIGGNILIDSKPEIGTTFTIKLPK